MRILYGVNGEGMGHATRSEVIIQSLLPEHDVRIMASGAAFKYLGGIFENVEEVFGPSFALKDGQIQRWHSITGSLSAARKELPENVRNTITKIHEWKPDVVVCDFEPLSGLYARWSRTPLVCVDNIHMIDRCVHDAGILEGTAEDARIARAVVKAMVPPAGDYVIPTFFHPELARDRTHLVPLILRQEIIDSKPTRGDHLVVYSGGGDELADALRDSPFPCHVYGMRDGDDVGTTDGAIEYMPRSVDGFLEDLVTSRGVITGGGFSLLGEAVYLGKPVLSVPLKGQFEQVMNARYLAREGFGACTLTIDHDIVTSFLSRLDEFDETLAGYSQDGNNEAIEVITKTVEAAAEESRRNRAKARRQARKAPR
ncbi:MAG: glycosyltransferase family protein [Solirubrobacterales bacterium]